MYHKSVDVLKIDFNSILMNSIKMIAEFLGCGLLDNWASKTVLGRRTVVRGVWLVVKEFALFILWWALVFALGSWNCCTKANISQSVCWLCRTSSVNPTPEALGNGERWDMHLISCCWIILWKSATFFPQSLPDWEIHEVFSNKWSSRITVEFSAQIKYLGG